MQRAGNTVVKFKFHNETPSKQNSGQLKNKTKVISHWPHFTTAHVVFFVFFLVFYENGLLALKVFIPVCV